MDIHICTYMHNFSKTDFKEHFYLNLGEQLSGHGDSDDCDPDVHNGDRGNGEESGCVEGEGDESGCVEGEDEESGCVECEGE